jgi:hypothetical protein
MPHPTLAACASDWRRLAAVVRQLFLEVDPVGIGEHSDRTGDGGERRTDRSGQVPEDHESDGDVIEVVVHGEPLSGAVTTYSSRRQRSLDRPRSNGE